MHNKLIRKELLALAILMDDERYYGEGPWQTAKAVCTRLLRRARERVVLAVAR